MYSNSEIQTIHQQAKAIQGKRYVTLDGIIYVGTKDKRLKLDETAKATSNLTTTGVIAGTYGDADTVGQFTVDDKGRITSATNIDITATTISGFDEAAQDAVGTILTDTSTIDFTYDDAAATITADVLLTATRIGFGSGTGYLSSDAGFVYNSTTKTLTLGVASTTSGQIVLQTSANAFTTTIKTGVTGASYTLTLPTTDGNANEFLQTDGSGVTSWATALTSVPNLTAVLTAGNVGVGLGATSATSVMTLQNSALLELFRIYNDGKVTAGVALGSMTIGLGSGFDATLQDNTFLGVDIATALTTGAFNVGVGTTALNKIQAGNFNMALGCAALYNLINGTNNVAMGYSAATNLTSGLYNTAVGDAAMGVGIVTGNSNVAIGALSLSSLTSGAENTAIGLRALFSILTGNFNVAIGDYAGNLSTGSSNVFLGSAAGQRQTTESNQLFIDNQDRGSKANELIKALIYGIFDAATANQYLTVNGNLIAKESFKVGVLNSILGSIGLYGSTSGIVTIQPKAIAGTWTLTLPDNDGNANDVLTTDGTGVTSWVAPSAGSSNSDYNNQFLLMGA